MASSRSHRPSFTGLESLESRTFLSGPGSSTGGSGGSGGPTPTPITVPLSPAPNLSGPGGGGGGGGTVTGGGGGGGGGGVVTTNPFVGHTWFGLIGAAAVGITFNANNTFTLVDTPPGGGPQITFQGSYTLGPAPDALGGVPQTQVTLISQGNVILSGAADFVTPDRIIFTLTSQNLPGASGALPGNMTQLAAGL